MTILSQYDSLNPLLTYLFFCIFTNETVVKMVMEKNNSKEWIWSYVLSYT